ncbi:glycosyltransferase [bacterium]|nr:glycosyltransferase [bacterium]
MRSGLRKTYAYFIATHVTESDGPGQALDKVLQGQKTSYVYVTCPFGYTTISSALVKTVWQGTTQEKKSGHANRGQGLLQWIRDMLFVFFAGWKNGSKDTVYIGINNLNAVVGLILRALGKCKTVIYYVIDYTPRRFSSRLLNAVYQSMARTAARRADWVWNLSERMREVHCSVFKSDPKKNRIVPIGIDSAAVQVCPEAAIEAQRLVMVSALFENKGIQLAIEAMSYLPQAHLTIVGTGPYEQELREFAKTKQVSERVNFTGCVTREQLFQEIAKSRVAIATYMPTADTYTQYADPAKPKEYLACGIPVVITRVPWIAEPIEKIPMGIAIDYDAKQLAQACEKLMSDQSFWQQCRKAALKYMQHSDWQSIFAKALDKL